jgi:hypothetical protein
MTNAKALMTNAKALIMMPKLDRGRARDAERQRYSVDDKC